MARNSSTLTDRCRLRELAPAAPTDVFHTSMLPRLVTALLEAEWAPALFCNWWRPWRILLQPHSRGGCIWQKGAYNCALSTSLVNRCHTVSTTGSSGNHSCSGYTRTKSKFDLCHVYWQTAGNGQVANTLQCSHDMGNNLTYLFTPWCRVLLEKLTGLQLVKKFPAFHGTQRFITALTSVRHLSLSWASPIQSIYPHPTSWRSILILSTHLRLGLASGVFPSCFPTKTPTTTDK